MSKVKVHEIECDVCHKTTAAKTYTKIPNGWLYITVGSINNRKDVIGLHLCPTHSKSVLKLVRTNNGSL